VHSMFQESTCIHNTFFSRIFVPGTTKTIETS
jgi:hypothetical protein